MNTIPETLRQETKDWNTEMEGNRAVQGIIYGGVEIDYLRLVVLEVWFLDQQQHLSTCYIYKFSGPTQAY